jgi:hypothetical protein
MSATTAYCDSTYRGDPTLPAARSQLDMIALHLNQRPRKAAGSQTPVSKLRASVAPTL